MKAFQGILKQFWNQPNFLPEGHASAVIDFLAVLVKNCKEDTAERLAAFPKAKAKMDQEDIEYFKEDLEKIDKISRRKSTIM